MRLFNPFSEDNYIKTLSVLCLLSFCLCGISGNLLIDEFEHLRAAYLVSIGQHPYTDFFEHHHPLLWWLWAPILHYLPRDQFWMVYIARIATISASCGGAYYIYKIAANFCGTRQTAILTLIIYFSFYFVQYMSVTIKPDAFMWCCYLGGLYHFFCFIETRRKTEICFCSIAFALGFMFSQTIVFLIFPLIFPTIYLIYKKRISIGECIFYSLPALTLLILFILAIHLTSGLENYYRRAWIFNTELFNLITIPIEAFLPKFAIYILFGFMAYGYSIKSGQATIYTHIFAIFLTIALIKNLVYWTPYPRYFQPEALAIAFLLAPIIPKLPKIGRNYFIAAICLFAILNSYLSLSRYQNADTIKQASSLDPQEKGECFFSNIMNIYATYTPFYWYSNTLAAIDDYLFDTQPDFDINKYISTQEADYILYNAKAFHIKAAIPAATAGSRFLEVLKRYTINENTLNAYYHKSVSETDNDVYRRRPEL